MAFGKIEFVVIGKTEEIILRKSFYRAESISHGELVVCIILEIIHEITVQETAEEEIVEEVIPEEPFEKDARKYCADHIRFDETIWREVTAKMSECGLNMVVMDLGEFMEFPSHPELAVKGSWSPERMQKELARLRGLGLEPIPKLNFSATHDQWLKIYHRMISTPLYRQVVRDVIRDTVEIFGTPRFFHLGWDEERALYAYDKAHFSMRQGELWWHDFLYSVKCVEDCGSRAWVWSDFGWEHKSYYKRCPKSVVQSNWYYDEELGQYSLDPKINKHAHRLFLEHRKKEYRSGASGVAEAFAERAAVEELPLIAFFFGIESLPETCGSGVEHTAPNFFHPASFVPASSAP